MREDALAQPYLCTDATGVLVQAKEKCRHGHFWVVVAPERHVLFAYSAKHDGAAVDALLAGYEGYLVADAHAVYDHLYARGDVDRGRLLGARAALLLQGARLRSRARAPGAGAHRRALRDRARDRRRAAARSARAVAAGASPSPIVDRLLRLVRRAEAGHVLDETPIAKAIGYARNQRAALQRFLDDGRLPHPQQHQRARAAPRGLGRKNWLFVGSDDGAEVNATFVSLLASCQLHGIEPWAYLRDLFCLLPSWPAPRPRARPAQLEADPRGATLSSASPPTSSGGRPSACSTNIPRPSSTCRRCRQRRCSPNGYSVVDLSQLAELPGIVQALQVRVQELERRLVVAERKAYSVNDAAKALGVSAKTVRRRITAGELQHKWTGKRVAVYLDSQ